MSQEARPNIVFIMCDDHASHAMSCYGSRINKTPQIDRIANEGMRFDNCFCTNSICTPSRASILTGTYNHVNGVTTLDTHMDNRLPTYASLMQKNGYQTGIFGKWHLGQGPTHQPRGFDEWAVLPGQGDYHDPTFIHPEGKKQHEGYVTDIITDMTMDFIKDRDKDQPFCVMCHHKAPHRHWEPDEKHAKMYEDEDIPAPDNFWDDYEGRSQATKKAFMRIADMGKIDYKLDPPEGLSEKELTYWKYQRYIKDYLRCVASVDDNTGRLLDLLDAEGLTENTIVIYTSDQGFFLGDHGWFDKRFMYEESLKMPFIVRYPKEIKAGSVTSDFALNVDFAPTFLDYANMIIPNHFQGETLRPIFNGVTPEGWQDSMYYRYWMHRDSSHNAYAHYGVRTHDFKLICYYANGCDQPGCNNPMWPEGAAGWDETPFGEEPIEWELFDLRTDPCEMKNVYSDPAYQDTIIELKALLARKQAEVGDEAYPGAD